MMNVNAHWSDKTFTTVNNVTVWNVFKVFLLIDNETYNLLSKNNKFKGRCFTDLLLRQVWVYSENPPCLLIYNDQNKAFYWKSFLNKNDNNNPKWRDQNQIPYLSMNKTTNKCYI